MIGFLDSGSPTGMRETLAAFHRGLAEAGYTEEQNVTVEYRWARGRYDQLRALAAELVARPVAVIVATRSSAPARAARASTSTIPIVFQSASADEIRSCHQPQDCQNARNHGAHDAARHSRRGD